jgi:phage tail tube protein FII
MAEFLIRFNKSRGMPGRGTAEHVWRVFEDGKEYLFKHVTINVPSQSIRTEEYWNIGCTGVLTIDRATSTAIIEAQ